MFGVKYFFAIFNNDPNALLKGHVVSVGKVDSAGLETAKVN